MRKRWVYLATFVVVAIGLAGGSYAVASADGPGNVPQAKRFHAKLNGFQEVSSISTPGFGTFEARLVNSGTIRYVLRYKNLEGTPFMAHIHFAQRSVNGGISVWLCGEAPLGPTPCPEEGTVRGTFTAANVIGPIDKGIEAESFRELLRAMRAGHTYVNVHTNPTFGGGEIRGQVNDRDQKEFVK